MTHKPGVHEKDDESHRGAVVGFFDRHPINEKQILDALAARGIAADALDEDDLKEFDQDHYGGIEALEALAAAAGIVREHHVLDICSGMGGPARYLAHRLGCRVTGIDLTESRVAGANRLTALARLGTLVECRTGDALALPFADGAFDVAIAQEAWAHIPDKPRLVAEAVRVLKPGGCLAFTDIVRLGELSADTANRLREGMAFIDIESPDGYAALLVQNGCEIAERVDLSGEWRQILRQRLAMYRSLRPSTVASFGAEGYERYDMAYSHFVSLYEDGVLGGVRFAARKRAARSPA